MRIIDADRLKIDYKSKIVINLIDPRRGIDLSHYAEDFCINFNKLVDNQPTVVMLEQIRDEIERLKTSDEYTGESILAVEFKDDVLNIIDYYMGDKE